MVDTKVAESIREFSIAAYPNEACGLIVADGKKAIVRNCRNISERPREQFLIDPEDYIAAADMGEVIGVWHSHPDRPAQPSEADMAGCEQSELPWYITSVKAQEDGPHVVEGPFVFEPSGFEAPYEERPYVFGVYDCYSLVRDYYLREFGISLANHRRVDNFWLMGLDYFSDKFSDTGFVRLIDIEPELGDLFIIQTHYSIPNHVAIYVGGDMILHHCKDRLSRKDIYGSSYWDKHTTIHLRHKEKLQ
jgi:proteasome lid subunit RPN8/RPN11